MSRLLISIALIILSQYANARSETKGLVEGEIIVRFPGQFNQAVAQSKLDVNQYKIKEVINPTLNMYLVEVEEPAVVAIKKLRFNEAILYAQPNHYIQYRGDLGPTTNSSEAAQSLLANNLLRGLPNDPLMNQMWSLMDPSVGTGGISANLVWNTSVGGKDQGGNDIVVAVVDGGVDVKHPDLIQNIWINKEEIPDNQIDDDGNGFVDDVYGWNAFNNNGNISSDGHGTHVTGTIGAMGNNSLGISGVNWNVKVMTVMGASGTTATVAKAYGYVIEQKKLWFASKGKKGANIVATNSSFGIDNVNCASGDYPIWNDLYENMGKLGILSATATANNNVNVDEVGDVPTGCLSEYIVTITNTQRDNTKYISAGYGLKTIDLGAPGTNIYSTLPGATFGLLTGTSMATPHVAGSIGLLHSVASPAFYEQYINDPGKAALVLKEALLQGTDPLPSLKGITVSGGKLNVSKAAQLVKNFRGFRSK
ncbi:MAG: S8 family serine peptidase [Bdellovibrionota bacterium]